MNTSIPLKTIDNDEQTLRLIEGKRFRLLPIWPEWNETEINNESWDGVVTIRRKETGGGRARADTKTNISNANAFEDPEGKVELPPSSKVEQWKRPIEFLPSEKPPLIVDPTFGIQNFDLITSNEHLHHNETMRNIISQITALWDICRKTSSNTNERTWRPWEHIYALNKISKQPFITPYNPAGKYIVRLFFLGTWRKIIIDDSIPFDSNNRCLLPQTSLSYELWPMLLTKALLKIISLNFNTPNDFPEFNESSIIHLLTGWIPEPIPLKYTHSEKVWNFLRYNRSNNNQSYSTTSFSPIPLYQWPETKNDLPEETINSIDQQDDKSSKKRRTPPISIKEKSSNSKDTKKSTILNRTISVDDTETITTDQGSFELPKLIIFATVQHLQPTRMSSFSEVANRSERLRHYNLNNTFSTSVLLTSIRDIPLEPPTPPESVPAWKLIRPRKAKLLPHAEIIPLQESKPERWIEIASPYINYPTASAINIKPTIQLHHSIDSNAKSSRVKHDNPSNIIEIDEDENSEQKKVKIETNVSDSQEKLDGSIRSTINKLKRDISVDKTKTCQKSADHSTKISSDIASIKDIGDESDQIVTPIDAQAVGNRSEQKNSSNPTPKIWMNFDDFCACFTSIIVYHNPQAYQYTSKYSEIKAVATPVPKERKKEVIQPIIPQIPNLHNDRSILYLFVDSTRETLNKNIELVISLTCLSRWYDAFSNDTIGSNEKSVRGASLSAEKAAIEINLSKPILSQKEIMPQVGSLIAEIYSWKSLTMGQPILRLHTTSTKAALLSLPPGRHVLKLTNTCPFAFNLQILSDTHDFMLGDEEQLLNKIVSVPEDAECLIEAEELFLALDDSIENFHLIDQQTNKLYDLFRLYCEQAPKPIHLTVEICLNIFKQALYSTLRTMTSSTGTIINADTQFAWRCFTDDRLTPDILSAYEPKRSTVPSAGRHSARVGGKTTLNTETSTTNKKTNLGREKTDEKMKSSSARSPSMVETQETISDILTRELSINEMHSITNIQKCIRGYLQRRMMQARTVGTEKNLFIQRLLQSTMAVLKLDSMKSASILFKNFLSIKPQLTQCFSFRNDDWNMINYRDYNGTYQEQPANTWFVLFREIFHATTENTIVAKFHSHLPNSILRVINNDTYEEMSLVFNRLAPSIFTKNQNGYTFFAEGISQDQPITNGRFRLRLITSYTQLPEIRNDQLTSIFTTKEIMDYYLPNREQIICRYRVIFAEDINQTGRNFHLASIHFNTSKSDVLLRLTVFDNDEEIVSIEGKGCLVLPAILFMRHVTHIVQQQQQQQQQQPPQPPSRPTSRTGGGGGIRKKDRGSISESSTMNSNTRLEKEKSVTLDRSESRTEFLPGNAEEKTHKYIIQVTLLRQSWPLTPTQWQFVEQLKEQEKNELKVFNRPPSPIKIEVVPSNTPPTTKKTGQTNPSTPSTTGKNRGKDTPAVKTNATTTVLPSITKISTDKIIDKSKPHWILQVISDGDKSEELTIKKDTERNDEFMNIKKAWETVQVGRAEKAMRTRQKFLDSLQVKNDEKPLPNVIDDTKILPAIHTDEETIPTHTAPIIEQQQTIKQISHSKKNSLTIKKGSIKDDIQKITELIPIVLPSKPQIDEPLLNEPPQNKPKITLPLLDIKPFLKQKLFSNEPIISDSFFEQKNFERRQNLFSEYSKSINEIRLNREDDQNNRHNEKLRQIEEYSNLQAKIDQTRRTMNESHEAFRQRFLELEQKRIQQITEKEENLIKPKAVITTKTKK
ncbi:unnamed protein product [Adineta steineri]|uniref:Calpain catalytic domain-containing protein n=1 Tax=Adineta steineri TaxID=433720 RepID=A0A813NG67_9BILA|nr:unnamed protein product [Adineta steineri]